MVTSTYDVWKLEHGMACAWGLPVCGCGCVHMRCSASHERGAMRSGERSESAWILGSLVHRSDGRTMRDVDIPVAE